MPPPNTSAQPATRGDEDPASPTVMLQSFLRSKGMPLTAQNMQRALMANASGSTEIPGLVNDTPSTDPGVGGQGNVAGRIEQAPTRGAMPTPPVPPAAQPTSAPPTQAQGAAASPPDSGSLQGLGAAILGGLGLGGGALAARGIPGQPGATSSLFAGQPQPGGGVPPPVDPAAQVMAAEQATPQPAETGDRFGVQEPASEAETDPLQAALAKAVPPGRPAVLAAQETLRPGYGGPSTPIGPSSPTGVAVPTDVQSGGFVPRPPGMPDRSLTIPPVPGTPVAPVRTTEPGIHLQRVPRARIPRVRM